MSPIYLGPAHDVRGVEVLVCVSCDIYIVFDGLGHSGKHSHPPAVTEVFCLCRRNGSSRFRFCLPAAPSPFFLLLGFFRSRTPCVSLSSTQPSFRGAWPFEGVGGGPALALEVSSPHFRRFLVGEAPSEPRLLRARAIRLLPPSGGGGSSIIAPTGVICAC